MVPEHQRVAEKISRLRRQQGNQNHTLLVHGPAGSVIEEVALRIGQSLFCETGVGEFGACDQCRDCRRVRQGIHPDWITLAPTREGKALPNITIEALRNLQDRMVLEPYEANRVVGCLFAADKMRPESANSMLKLLEEPPPHAVFILVTESRARMLPTILSRSLSIPVYSPSPEYLAEQYKNRPRDEALQGARWALYEGLSVDLALSEQQCDLRQEVQQILDSAIREGEWVFLGSLKSRKLEREESLAWLRMMRDLLRDTLLVQSGGDPLTYPEAGNLLVEWGKALSGEDLADHIDRSLLYEESINGYANPLHALGSFLSELGASSRLLRPVRNPTR